MREFFAAMLGAFVGSGIAFFWVFKTWKFPRIVVVPMEKLGQISRELGVKKKW